MLWTAKGAGFAGFFLLALPAQLLLYQSFNLQFRALPPGEQQNLAMYLNPGVVLVTCLLLAAAPVGIAYFPSSHGQDAFKIVALLGMMFTLMVIGPLIGLLAGSAVVTEEIENRTITYVFTRPVHRASLFLGRWMATLVL